MKFLNTFFLCAIIVLLFWTFVIAQEEPYQPTEEFPEGLEQNFRDLGIDPNLVSNCGACSYDAGSQTLFLTSTSNIDLSTANLKEGTIIQLQGGTLIIPGGTISGQGSYTAGDPPSLQDGSMEFDPTQKSTTLNFKNSVIATPSGGEVSGNGRIEKGIIIIDEGDIAYEGVAEHIRQARVEQFQEGKIYLLAGKEFRLGSGRDTLFLGDISGESVREIQLFSENGETTIKVGLQLSDPESPYRKPGRPPVFVVNGKPTVKIADHGDVYNIINEERAEVPYEQEFSKEATPLTIEIQGKDHKFTGPLIVRNGNVFIPTKDNENDISARMIDGVYVDPRSEVNIYFDDQKRTGENYIAMGEKLQMGGDNFRVALSEEGPGCPDYSFCHDFIRNKYAVKKESDSSPFRLLVDFDGRIREKSLPPGEEQLGSEPEFGYGEVTIDPQQKTIVSKGTLTVINGVNEFKYYMHEGEQKYNFRPTFCGEILDSCTALDYDLVDGGKVNVVKRINVIPSRKGSDMITFDSNVQGKLEKRQAIVDKEGVYVLAYKGGEFPNGFFGGTMAENKFGHVGLLYCASSSNGCEWIVTEARGGRVTVTQKPLDQSLFGKFASVDFIGRVVDDSGKPLSVDKVIRYTEAIVGAPYGKYSLTGSTFSCVEVVCESVKAAGNPLRKPENFIFASIPSDQLSWTATLYEIGAAGPFSSFIPDIPDSVIKSPNLQPVEMRPLPPSVVNPDMLAQNVVEENTIQ